MLLFAVVVIVALFSVLYFPEQSTTQKKNSERQISLVYFKERKNYLFFARILLLKSKGFHNVQLTKRNSVEHLHVK